MKSWWKTSSTNSEIINIVQKNSKGNNPLDYLLNTVDKLYIDINNKLSNLRSSCLDEFRWYRDTYSAMLGSSLGLKGFFLKLSSLGLEVNLGIASLFLVKDKIRLWYIDNISKSDRITPLDKSKLNNSSKIRDQFRKLHSKEKINDLCNLKNFIINLNFK